MAITPGQTYSFTVYYRGEIDQAQSDISLYGGYALCGVFLQYYNSAGQALPSGGTWSCDTQRVWQRYAVSTTPPSGAAKARVLLLSYGMAGWAAFDDIEFKATNATTNLVTNGNFEGGTGGWTKKWVMTGNNAKAYPATGFTRDSTGIGAGRNGSNGYAIGNLATGYVVSSPVAVTPGQTYLIGAWLRGQLNEQAGQGDWRIRAQFYSSNGLDLGYQEGCYGFSEQTLTWAQAQCYVLPPQNAATMRLQLWLVQESGWVAFDDLTVDDQTVDTLTSTASPRVRQGADATNTYYFNGQRLAVRQGRALAYLHTDALGSTKLVTDQDGTVIQRATRYYAYGRTRTPGSIAGLPTDYTFTGQRQDNTGLIYMNARYYDPEVGQFLSPDTEIPDPINLFDYNRYMYARGNPLKYNDPSGHETSKPEWWPDSLPYTFDLPDGMTKAQFIEWTSENNIPTTIGGQIGVDFNATAGAGVATSVEGCWLFNWWSGEFVYQGTGAVGLVASPSVNLGIAGGHAGATWVAGASSIRDSIKGYSRYQSVSVQADAIAKAGLSVTTAKSIPGNPSNPDILLVSQMSGTYIDPVFDRSVDTLALNAVAGLDPVPNGVDASYSTGFSKTSTYGGFNLYTPVVNFYNQWFH